MAKGIMYVETQLSSPELAEEYHRQYDEVHLPEIVAIDGFVSARRFEPVGHDGPFVAIYEIDADDLDGARTRLMEASRAGRITIPAGMRLDPGPEVRYYREIAVYPPESPRTEAV